MIENSVLHTLVRKNDKNKDPEIEKILVDQNTFPWKAKIGMVFSCYTSHLPFMRYALKQYRKIDDMYIVGAFDNRMVTPDTHRRNFPTNEIMSLAHSWVFKHYTFGGHAKRHGWLWSQIYASSILRTFENIEYIVLANGDCVWDKPQGIYKIINMMESDELDFMSGQSFTRKTDGFNFIHTCSMIFSSGAYWDFIDYIISNVENEKNTVSFSPEGLIQQWLKYDEWEWKHVPIQPKYPNGDHDMYCESSSESTWKNILGFRNLEAEKNYRRYNDLEPLEYKYFDITEPLWYKDIDKNFLLKYYKTKNRKYLEKWWEYKKF